MEIGLSVRYRTNTGQFVIALITRTAKPWLPEDQCTCTKFPSSIGYNNCRVQTKHERKIHLNGSVALSYCIVLQTMSSDRYLCTWVVYFRHLPGQVQYRAIENDHLVGTFEDMCPFRSRLAVKGLRFLLEMCESSTHS